MAAQVAYSFKGTNILPFNKQRQSQFESALMTLLQTKSVIDEPNFNNKKPILTFKGIEVIIVSPLIDRELLFRAEIVLCCAYYVYWLMLCALC